MAKKRSLKSTASSSTDSLISSSGEPEALPEENEVMVSSRSARVSGSSIVTEYTYDLSNSTINYSDDAVITKIAIFSFYLSKAVSDLSGSTPTSIRVYPGANVQKAAFVPRSRVRTTLPMNLETMEHLAVTSSSYLSENIKNVIPIRDGSNLKVFVGCVIKEPLKAGVEFTIEASYVDSSGLFKIAKIKASLADKVFSDDELIAYDYTDYVPNQTIFYNEEHKYNPDVVKKPTVIRYNYKINNSTLFNQSSSFLYSTLNRIPIISMKPEELDLQTNMTSSLKTTEYVDFTESFGPYPNHGTSKRFLETGLPRFRNLSATGTRSVEGYSDLVRREIQENLGISPSRPKKSHFKLIGDQDNKLYKPRNASYDQEYEDEDALFRSETTTSCNFNNYILSNAGIRNKITHLKKEYNSKFINKNNIINAFVNYGYVFQATGMVYLDEYKPSHNTTIAINLSGSNAILNITQQNRIVDNLTINELFKTKKNFCILHAVLIEDARSSTDVNVTRKLFDFDLINIRPSETEIYNSIPTEYQSLVSSWNGNASIEINVKEYFSHGGIYSKYVSDMSNLASNTILRAYIGILGYNDEDEFEDMVTIKREIKTFPRLTKRYNSAMQTMFYGILDFDGDLRGSEDNNRGNLATSSFLYRDYRQLFTGTYESHFGIGIKEIGAYGLDPLLVNQQQNLNNIKNLSIEYYDSIDREYRLSGITHGPNKRSTRTLNKLTGSFTSKTLLLADSNKFLVRENDSNIAMYSNWSRYFNNNSYLDIDLLKNVSDRYIGNDFMFLIDDKNDLSLSGSLKATSLIGDYLPNTVGDEIDGFVTSIPNGLSMYIQSLYIDLQTKVTKYGYSGTYSSTSTLGRFVMSGEDFNKMMGTPHEDCWWEGLSYFVNTITLNNVTTLEFSRPANRTQIGYFVNNGSATYFTVGNNGFFAYVKIFEVLSDGTKVLLDDFFSVDQESSINYTTAHDSEMVKMFPSFINISVYGSEVRFKKTTFTTPKNLVIEYHAQDNDSSINVTLNRSDEYIRVNYRTPGSIYSTITAAGYNKYSYTNNWNSSTALGRFKMSPEDFNNFIGAPNKEVWWEGLRTGVTRKDTYENVSTIEFLRPANNYNYLKVIINGSTEYNLPTVSGGYLCYIKISDFSTRELLEEFIYSELPLSGDYTTSKDSLVRADYPSFVNISRHTVDTRFNRIVFPRAIKITIEFAGRSDDNSFTVNGYSKKALKYKQFKTKDLETYGSDYNDSYGTWSNYDSQIAAKYGYPNGRNNDGLSRFYCKFDEYKEISKVVINSETWGPKDYESYTITTTNLNNKQKLRIRKVLIKTVGTYVEVYLNDSTSYHIRQNISGQSFLYVLKDKNGIAVDDIFIMFIQGSGLNTANRDAEMKKKFPNFNTIVDPSGTNIILEKTYDDQDYEITCACKSYSHYIRAHKIIAIEDTYGLGNMAIESPKNTLPNLTNKALETIMVFSNNKIKTKTIDPTIFEKFYNNVGAIKPPFMNHVMLDLGPSIDTREYFFITDEATNNNIQYWQKENNITAKGLENQLVYTSHVSRSHHGFMNVANLASIGTKGEMITTTHTKSTYGVSHGLLNYIHYLPDKFEDNGADAIAYSDGAKKYTIGESLSKMTFNYNIHGCNVIGKTNTFTEKESDKNVSSITSVNVLSGEELDKYFNEQTKVDRNQANPYIEGGMRIAAGNTSIYPFYGGMSYKIFNNSQKETKNDYSGTFLTPIPLFTNPMVNGMNYRLAINYGLHGGNGLSVLCENQVFSTSNNATGLNVFNTYNDVYVGWGNGGSYVAQRANMSTTVGLQTNASYCKWSPYRKILENASKKYRDEKDKVNSTRYKDSLYLGKDPLDIANASNYIPVSNLATETGYNKDNLLLPSERWRNIFVTYDCDIEFVGNTIFAHSPDGNGVDTESKHIMFTKPLRLKIVETYPTNSTVRTQLDNSKRYIEVKENGKEIPSLSKQVMISHDGSRLLTTADDIERDYAANQQGGGSTINFPKFVQAYTLSQFEIPLEMKTTSRPDNIVKNWLLQKTNISLSFDVNDMFIPSKLYLASDLGVFKSATLHSQQNDFFKRLHKYTIGSGSLDRPYSTVILDVMNRNNYKEICESNADFAQEAEEDFSFLSSLDDLEGIDNSEGMNVKPNYDKNRELMHNAYLTNGHDFMIANVTDDYTPPVKN